MCIVLPQGRLKNTSVEAIREFISDGSRIVGVVGLHQNTFKPHTGSQTRVLFPLRLAYRA
jgi:type I restriction enzyme M protein